LVTKDWARGVGGGHWTKLKGRQRGKEEGDKGGVCGVKPECKGNITKKNWEEECRKRHRKKPNKLKTY